MATGKDDYTREQLVNELTQLIDKLESTHHQECYPKEIYPPCPKTQPPEPKKIPHPLVPGLEVISQPKVTRQNVKVTVDGRMAEFFEPEEYHFDEPPLSLPPWVTPSINNVELRGGIFYEGCKCWKRDGLQDSCNRWDCGRPECLTKPLPTCLPSMDAPICGVRRGNALIPPLAARKEPVLPPAPYPGTADGYTKVREKIIPPNPPAIHCPLHKTILPYCNA